MLKSVAWFSLVLIVNFLNWKPESSFVLKVPFFTYFAKYPLFLNGFEKRENYSFHEIPFAA